MFQGLEYIFQGLEHKFQGLKQNLFKAQKKLFLSRGTIIPLPGNKKNLQAEAYRSYCTNLNNSF